MEKEKIEMNGPLLQRHSVSSSQHNDQNTTDFRSREEGAVLGAVIINLIFLIVLLIIILSKVAKISILISQIIFIDPLFNILIIQNIL